MLRTSTILILSVSVLAVIQPSCRKPVVEEENVEQDKILARVYNKTLHLSDIKDIGKDLSSRDSALRVNAAVERWVREALLMHEAEKHVPKDMDIDQLVRNYRASLILNTYESQLVKQELDSVVTPEQLVLCYNSHKDQYLLRERLIQYYYMKVADDRPELKTMENHWKHITEREPLLALREMCVSHAEAFQLQDSIWYPAISVVALFPKGKLAEKTLTLKEYVAKDSTHTYFLKITNIKERGELSPLSYIAYQLKRMILFTRKAKILKNKKEELYEREMHRENVEIYVN